MPIPEQGDPVVVELGPGTGSFTAEIQRRLGGRGRHLAVEINPKLAAHLSDRHPGVEVVVDDACGLPGLLGDRGVAKADVIISGLPWAAFSPSCRTACSRPSSGSLAPGGAFTMFAYVHAMLLPPALRIRRSLFGSFEEVVMGRTVWPNLPPAFVYHARRPRENTF